MTLNQFRALARDLASLSGDPVPDFERTEVGSDPLPLPTLGQQLADERPRRQPVANESTPEHEREKQRLAEYHAGRNRPQASTSDVDAAQRQVAAKQRRRGLAATADPSMLMLPLTLNFAGHDGGTGRPGDDGRDLADLEPEDDGDEPGDDDDLDDTERRNRVRKATVLASNADCKGEDPLPLSRLQF